MASLFLGAVADKDIRIKRWLRDHGQYGAGARVEGDDRPGQGIGHGSLCGSLNIEVDGQVKVVARHRGAFTIGEGTLVGDPTFGVDLHNTDAVNATQAVLIHPFQTGLANVVTAVVPARRRRRLTLLQFAHVADDVGDQFTLRVQALRLDVHMQGEAVTPQSLFDDGDGLKGDITLQPDRCIATVIADRFADRFLQSSDGSRVIFLAAADEADAVRGSIASKDLIVPVQDQTSGCLDSPLREDVVRRLLGIIVGRCNLQMEQAQKEYSEEQDHAHQQAA